jgi:hypothetical protein
MFDSLDRLERLFALTSFGIQIVLLLYFGLRKWSFETAMRVGWIVYALAIPAVIVSVLLLRGGKPWSLWLSGFIFSGWAAYGFYIDIVRAFPWRHPIVWPVFFPYVFLYTTSQLFYWFSLGGLRRELWFIYAGLFVLSTFFNVTSHAW